MKKFILSVVLCLPVILLITLSLSGRESHSGISQELLSGVSADTPTVNTSLLAEKADTYNDLALRLLNACHGEDNTLIVPLSTFYGLAMTANGAGGETLAQLENAFGMSVSEMNEYLYSYSARLDRSGETLSTANALWISESGQFKVNQDFLKTCATWYDAELYQTEFNTEALNAINAWGLENTGGAVDELISAFLQPDGILLLGTVLFEAHWETPFSESRNQDGVFTREDGTEVSAVYMSSIEDLYLENEFTTGFLKNYWSDGYVFAVLLPREGTTVEELLSATSGHSLSELLDSATDATVHVTMPKFTAGVSLNMIAPLMELGITDVFDTDAADLTGIGDNHLRITDIRQEAHITVDEIGTRAVAASAIAAFPASAREPLEDKYVDLNRPFVYMILETRNYTPVFLGTVMTTE